MRLNSFCHLSCTRSTICIVFTRRWEPSSKEYSIARTYTLRSVEDCDSTCMESCLTFLTFSRVHVAETEVGTAEITCILHRTRALSLSICINIYCMNSACIRCFVKCFWLAELNAGYPLETECLRVSMLCARFLCAARICRQ